MAARGRPTTTIRIRGRRVHQTREWEALVRLVSQAPAIRIPGSPPDRRSRTARRKLIVASLAETARSIVAPQPPASVDGGTPTDDAASERTAVSEHRTVTHHVATTVQRAVDDVAAYLFDPRTMPQWSAVLYAVQNPDDVPLLRRGRRYKQPCNCWVCR